MICGGVYLSEPWARTYPGLVSPGLMNPCLLILAWSLCNQLSLDAHVLALLSSAESFIPDVLILLLCNRPLDLKLYWVSLIWDTLNSLIVSHLRGLYLSLEVRGQCPSIIMQRKMDRTSAWSSFILSLRMMLWSLQIGLLANVAVVHAALTSSSDLELLN